MSILLDTNVLVRLANSADQAHAIAEQATNRLHQQAETLAITAQNLVEFRSVATRPIGANGLGLSVAVVESITAAFEQRFMLLEETPAIYPAWKAIVAATGCVGKQVHDARLVAVRHAHGVSHLLTFNGAHFARFSGCAPGLTVLDPTGV
jgi:predicted nucleic acid-binding protein